MRLRTKTHIPDDYRGKTIMKFYQRIMMRIGAVVPPNFRNMAYRTAGMTIGERTRIPKGFYVDRPEGVTIGEHCFLNHFVHLHNGADEDAKISFGDNVFVGPEAMFVCASHEYGTEEQRAGKNKYGSIVVEDGVWIGAGAKILPGVKIGRGGNRSRSCCY